MTTTRFIQGLIIILGLVGLYYLYQYLFGAGQVSSTTIIGARQKADTNPSKPVIVHGSSLPGIYEGGEFSISMWLYVQNWSYRQGHNKHILSIGGRNFDTIRIYLGANKCQLRVRMHTAQQGKTAPGPAESPSDNLDAKNQQAVFTSIETDSGLLDTNTLCDLPEFEMQRWVNVVVAVNNKTVDIYMDGKLARSCVLPSVFKVDHGGYSVTALDYGGFGGFISNVAIYGSALGPDSIYRMYMAGPDPITNLGDYLKSFFMPSPSD